MATIFTTDLNSLHFNRFNYALPAKYKNLDMYDTQFQNRKNTIIIDSYYYQLWEKTDSIFIQAITNGLSVVNVEVYTCKGLLVSNNAMIITADVAVRLPYVKQNYSIDLSTFNEGLYYVILSSNGISLRISEILNVKITHYGSKLIEYSNTVNKLSTFFDGVNPMIRVGGILSPWTSDSEFTVYQDELADYEMQDTIPSQQRDFKVPLIPDWMDNKINSILGLNRTIIEGIRYSRTTTKKDIKKYDGTDLATYTYEVARARNNRGLATTETGGTDNLVVTYTLDARAFGQGDGSTFDIDIEEDD